MVPRGEAKNLLGVREFSLLVAGAVYPVLTPQSCNFHQEHVWLRAWALRCGFMPPFIQPFQQPWEAPELRKQQLHDQNSCQVQTAMDIDGSNLKADFSPNSLALVSLN